MKMILTVCTVMIFAGCQQSVTKENYDEQVALNNNNLNAWADCKIELAELRKQQTVNTWTVKSWVIEDGKLKDVRIQTSDDLVTKLVWLKVGNKVVIGKWFTHGKEVQKIRTDKLKGAWLDNTKGVYLLDARDKVFLEFALDLVKNRIVLEIS